MDPFRRGPAGNKGRIENRVQLLTDACCCAHHCIQLDVNSFGDDSILLDCWGNQTMKSRMSQDLSSTERNGEKRLHQTIQPYTKKNQIKTFKARINVLTNWDFVSGMLSSSSAGQDLSAVSGRVVLRSADYRCFKEPMYIGPSSTRKLRPALKYRKKKLQCSALSFTLQLDNGSVDNMIMNSREKDFQGKREGEDGSKYSKAASTSRHWSAFRNPRIVRASRSCGGKDRHSKVCTIRGLRDRRIRLSVPTAIQLYDLQDRLGLAQPSKVIDWLIDATKTDIDKLPPLQFPQGFGQLHQQMLVPHQLRASDQSSIPPLFDINASYAKDSLGIKIDNSPDREEQNTLERSKYLNIEASLREKSKEGESITDQKGKWIETNDPQYQGGICNYSSSTGQAQRFFPLAVHSSLPSLLNSSMPFNSYHHVDASNLSFPQIGTHGVVSHSANSLNSNTVPFPSSLPLSAGSQLLFCPPATMSTLFSPFNPYGNATIGNSREINHFQLLGSSPSQHRISGSHAMSSSSVKTFPFNLNPGPVHFQSSNDDHHNKYNVNS